MTNLDRLAQRTQAYLDSVPATERSRGVRAAALLDGSGRTVCRLGFMCGVAALYCRPEVRDRRSRAAADEMSDADPEEFIAMPEWGWPRVTVPAAE